MKKLPEVAYFCMEFGIHEDFKTYAGGLGILAGDILKTAKDSKLPMVGIGILWRQGYTKQIIEKNEKPCDCYPEYSYDFLEDTGVKVEVTIRGREVKCKVWKCANFSNVPLYLLDANIPENSEPLLTGQLYGWFPEERVAQEIILGIGGVRVLRALNIDIDVYHFNDSHPIPAGIELIREKMDEKGMSFEDAWDESRKQIVFTTHTPVIEGNEVHNHELLQYMGMYNGLNYDQMSQIGGVPFSMTAAGLRLSRKSNAVSKLHGNTARKMWAGVGGSSEIISITNGVHNKTWQDKIIINASSGKSDLWDAHLSLKKKMIKEIYKINGIRLKEEPLAIGFARRAAPYKRSDLIFRKPEIIEPLLKEGKLQLIFSGKAHPNDLVGKNIVSNLYSMTKLYPGSVVFLQDYDMKIGKMLTRGCDVWLNNPIRPMEACGTSGIKAAMNGVLNLSVLDGWWPEGCEHGVNGWQIGNGYEGKDHEKNDSESLYKVLLEELIPTYYNDRARWVKMMRSSIKMAEYNFSAEKMLKEYYNKMYEEK